MEIRCHCTNFDNYDLCITCYQKSKLPDNMEKGRYDLDDEPSYNVQKQATPQDANSHRIPIIIHAYHCRDVNCHLVSFQCMKMVTLNYIR